MRKVIPKIISFSDHLWAFANDPSLPYKGQLISELHFGDLNFPKYQHKIWCAFIFLIGLLLRFEDRISSNFWKIEENKKPVWD